MLIALLFLLTFIAGYYAGKIAMLGEATKDVKDSTKTTTKRKEWKR